MSFERAPVRESETEKAAFETMSEEVRIEGLNFHKREHDAEGRDPKVFHTSEHPRAMEQRGDVMADIFRLSPEERGVMDSAIAWHDTVIEYDPADPDNLLATIKRHRGAREGDKPFGAEGNEAKSARLMEEEMRKENERAGKDIFTEEQIRTAVQAVEATYPDVNLGADFKGASFEEYPYFKTALLQNPDLRGLFGELKKDGIEKGPLFFQPHLENALERGESVPREVLITALADLGAAGCAKAPEFFKEGDSEMRELYANLRRPDVMNRLFSGDGDTDKADRAKVTAALTGWLNSQPGFAAWQALRFEKIVHLLKEQNALSPEEEGKLRGQFGNFPENVRAARDRAQNIRERVQEISSLVGEKEAFFYAARGMGFEAPLERKLEGEREAYIGAYRRWVREPKRNQKERAALLGVTELHREEYERVLQKQASDYYARRREGLEREEGVDPSEIEELEKQFRAETFREFIVREQDNLNKAKIESRPQKDQNIFKKVLNKWSHLPKAARWAISAGIATGVAVAAPFVASAVGIAVAGGGLVASGAGGIALYAGARFGRAALSGLTTLGSERLIALGLKGWDKFIGKKKTREYRVAELEAEGTAGMETNLKEVGEKYRTILEETARRERRRNLGKFVAAAAAGGAAGIFGGGLVDKLLGAAPPTEVPEAVPETEAPPMPIEVETPMEVPSSSVLEHLEYRGGPHVWGEIERQIDARTSFKGIFEGMEGDELEAHRTHFVDYFKDKVYEHPEAYGLPEGMGVDGLPEAELRNVDWDKLFNEVAGSPEEMRRALPNLTPDEVHSIIESNERMRELFAAKPITAETPTPLKSDFPTPPKSDFGVSAKPVIEPEAPEAPAVETELMQPEVPEPGTVKPPGVEVPITVEVEPEPEPIESAVPETVPIEEVPPAQTLGEAYYARMQEDGGTLLKRITPEAVPEAASQAAVERALHTDALVHEVAVKLLPSHDTSFTHLTSLAQGEGLTESQANHFVENLMQGRGDRRIRRGLLAFFMDKEPSPNSIFKRWVWNADKFRESIRLWIATHH